MNSEHINGRKNNPRVSIITATYNHNKFIGQCIESVLDQTYPNWEQIIIDDGSTDGTDKIISKYKDKRIKYIRQENVGIWDLAKTYNRALQISEGELIAVLEGDDFWPPDKLEKQIPVFDRIQVVLSWGKVAITSNDGETSTIRPKDLKCFKNKKRWALARRLMFQNFIPACTVMCRKEALLSIGGFLQPERVPYVDYPTWLELCLIGELYPIDEILGYWRRHGRQITSTIPMEMINAQNRCSMDLFERLPQDRRNSLGISTKDLLNQYQYNIASGYFVLGRMELTQGKWGEARKNFGQALDKGTPHMKIRSLLGIACSYFKIDMEWIAILMRRPRISKF